MVAPHPPALRRRVPERRHQRMSVQQGAHRPALGADPRPWMSLTSRKPRAAAA
jgi:hypothetical protein